MNTGNGTTYGRLNFAFPQSSRKNSDATGRVDHLISHFTGSGETLSTFPSVDDDSPVKAHLTGRSASPVRRQYTDSSTPFGGMRSSSPIKGHYTGSAFSTGDMITPQLSGSGLPITHRPMSVLGMSRNTSPVKSHGTGSGVVSPLVPQVTGGRLPITRPRPKSVMSIRSGASHRGIELVRQMTGTDS